MIKICSKCNIPKKESDFYKNRPDCKECKKLKTCKYRQLNKDTIKVKKAKAYLESRDSIILNKKNKYCKNKESLNEKRREKYNEFKDLFRIIACIYQRKARELNPD